MDAPHEQHRRSAAGVVARCCVLSVSDTRSAGSDESGAIIVGSIVGRGHRVIDRRVVRDEPDDIRGAIQDWCSGGSTDVIVITGGTGVGPRDVTVDTVGPMFSQTLPAFASLFTMLSHQQVGPSAHLSRACAGIVRHGNRRTAVYALPGSPRAVELAMNQIIAPELAHVVKLLGNPTDPG